MTATTPATKRPSASSLPVAAVSLTLPRHRPRWAHSHDVPAHAPRPCQCLLSSWSHPFSPVCSAPIGPVCDLRVHQWSYICSCFPVTPPTAGCCTIDVLCQWRTKWARRASIPGSWRELQLWHAAVSCPCWGLRLWERRSARLASRGGHWQMRPPTSSREHRSVWRRQRLPSSAFSILVHARALGHAGGSSDRHIRPDSAPSIPPVADAVFAAAVSAGAQF